MKIIQDTREQKPLDFSFFGHDTTLAKLSYGDYSLQGYEELVFIERKASTGELAHNLGKGRDAFFREFERGRNAKYKYVICEFTYDNILEYPANSGIPANLARYVKMNSGYMLKLIEHLEIVYGVQFVFCGDRETATEKIIEILDLCRRENPK